MSTIVPLISSAITGPLGVRHLPRLWLKVSLEARGKLAAGYPGIGHGYDIMVIEGLGLKPEAVSQFIKDARPTYPQFEAWIKQQPGVKLDKASIHRLNMAIAGYMHTDDVRQGILKANGLPDDGSVLPDAINLNNLDDWFEFHQAELK
jgi:phage tail protein X